MKAIDKFDDAIRAVALATTVPEAKEWRDKAEAMTHWAKRAKNKKLLQDAIEIKMEAERRGGQLLIEMAKSGERAGRGRGDAKMFRRETFKLPDLGVSRIESHRWQAIARMSADKWDAKKRHIKGIAVATLEGATEIVKAARAERTKEKSAKRQKRERELGEKQIALPGKKFGVILADPEWRFEPWSRESGMDRSADNHYPTSLLETIKTRPVESIAADDCILFLWATQPMERHAHAVMEAWGFDFRSQAIWRKKRPGRGRGTGYWFINEHEILLVGVRGKIPAPAPGTQWPSVIEAPVGKHSEKPEIFYEMIEQYFPNLPKIELNARKARKGWDRWGNEAPEAEAAE